MPVYEITPFNHFQSLLMPIVSMIMRQAYILHISSSTISHWCLLSQASLFFLSRDSYGYHYRQTLNWTKLNRIILVRLSIDCGSGCRWCCPIAVRCSTTSTSGLWLSGPCATLSWLLTFHCLPFCIWAHDHNIHSISKIPTLKKIMKPM